MNLPVFTGKLQVTHVNCVRGLFTCSSQVKFPAFAGNFGRVSFTVNGYSVSEFVHILENWEELVLEV